MRPVRRVAAASQENNFILVLYIDWVMLHRNRHIGASERRQLLPHVRFQLPFSGPESQLKSDFPCAGLLCPNLYTFCLSCNLCLDGSAFPLDFAILRSHF